MCLNIWVRLRITMWSGSRSALPPATNRHAMKGFCLGVTLATACAMACLSAVVALMVMACVSHPYRAAAMAFVTA